MLPGRQSSQPLVFHLHHHAMWAVAAVDNLHCVGSLACSTHNLLIEHVCMVCFAWCADVNAALVHTLGLIASHAIHTLHTSQQRLIIRQVPRVLPSIL
jgi:hypothetical protein